MTRTYRSGTVLLGLLGAGAIFTAAGCGSAEPNLPKTYPVQGRVTYRGGQPVAGGMIEFRPTVGSPGTTAGEIQADGRYTLHTLIQGRKVAGAASGPYQVTVIPSSGADQIAEPRMLPRPYTVEPRDNEINIEIDRKPRR